MHPDSIGWNFCNSEQFQSLFICLCFVALLLRDQIGDQLSSLATTFKEFRTKHMCGIRSSTSLFVTEAPEQSKSRILPCETNYYSTFPFLYPCWQLSVWFPTELVFNILQKLEGRRAQMSVFSDFREKYAYFFAPKVLTTTEDGEYENQREQDQCLRKWKWKWKKQLDSTAFSWC